MSNSDVEDGGVVNPHVEYQESNSAFGNRVREFDLVNRGFHNIEQFMLSAFEIYQVELTQAVEEFSLSVEEFKNSFVL